MRPASAALPPRCKSIRGPSSLTPSRASADPLLALTANAFIARCLRRLLANERAALLLANGTAPATGLAGTHRLQRTARTAARRQGRVVKPVALAGGLDAAALRRRYPWVVALLREISDD